MKKSLWQRCAFAVIGLALAGALAGCAAAAGGTSAVAVPAKPAARVIPPIPFKGTEKVDGLSLTLSVDHAAAADEYHIAVIADKPVKSVEAQMVMAEMGHGNIVELTQTAPDRFEADTNVVNMSGKWLARIEVETAADETKAVLFYMQAPDAAAN